MLLSTEVSGMCSRMCKRNILWQTNLGREPEVLEELLPVSFFESFGFELGDDGVRLEETPQDILNIFKGSVLAHSSRHVLCGSQEAIDLLPQFPWLNCRPGKLPELANLAPNPRKRGPYGLQVSQLLEHGLQACMTRQFEVECFLCATDEIILLLNSIKFPLEDVDGVHGRVSAHVPLHRTCLLPLLQNVVDLVLYNLVLGHNLQL